MSTTYANRRYRTFVGLCGHRSAFANKKSSKPTGARSEQVRIERDAKEAFEKGNFEAALKHFEHLMNLVPESAEILFNIGIIHKQLGRHELAHYWLRESQSFGVENPLRKNIRQAILRVNQ